MPLSLANLVPGNCSEHVYLSDTCMLVIPLAFLEMIKEDFNKRYAGDFGHAIVRFL
jgi:hypothetical protein